MNDMPEALAGGDEEPRTWRDRLGDLAQAASTLFQTRLQIFSAELSLKAIFAARGAAAFVVAAGLGIGVLLLMAALLAAIFAALFHSLILGILSTLVLYAAGLAGAGWYGWKQISQVRPSEFPATSAELASDLAAIRTALEPEPEAPEGRPAPPGGPAIPDEDEIEDLEARLRAGAE